MTKRARQIFFGQYKLDVNLHAVNRIRGSRSNSGGNVHFICATLPRAFTFEPRVAIHLIKDDMYMMRVRSVLFFFLSSWCTYTKFLKFNYLRQFISAF